MPVLPDRKCHCFEGEECSCAECGSVWLHARHNADEIIERLEAENARLREALEFYAHRMDWATYDEEPADRPLDNGRRARDALKVK